MNVAEKIARFKRNLMEYQSSLPEVVLLSVDANEGKILDLVRDGQLNAKGIDGTGNAIKPGYSPLTKRIKQSKGQVTSHVTLRDTGETQDTMLMEYGPDFFYPVATTPQVPKLERQYGKRIFDLAPDSVRQASLLLQADITKRSHEIIFK